MFVRIHLILLVLFSFVAGTAHGQISFVPNQGQWESSVRFQSDIPSGRAFFGDNKITYAYYSTEDVDRYHDADASPEEEQERSDDISADEEVLPVRCHAFQVTLEGATQATISGEHQKNYRNNYLLGRDSTRWASNVPVYASMLYKGIYPGIDLNYYSADKQLKYDFLVAAGSDPDAISMRYEGQRSLRLDGENLVIDLGFMQITEVIPSSYQIRNGVRQEVRCRFILRGNYVSFTFPDGYDTQFPLVIDPTLLASTFSGGSCVTRGYAATYDDAGNIYSSGICFSLGFPATLGAYSVNYSSAGDIGICKFNPDGSSLLYCTYLGGGGLESPHCLIVKGGNLYIYGTTFSPDFPVGAQAYSQTLNGICDIFIACLSNSGSTLIASTLIGGSWTDGLNMILAYRPDGHRGEIIIAANGDVLVASYALSIDFPTTPGAYRTTHISGQDAVVFRMNASLTTLLWSTYVGSGVHDAAYAIREGGDGSIYICGTSNNLFTLFPTVAGCYNTTPTGGSDAFIARFNATGSALLSSTYYGGADRDIAYFLDIDVDGDIYVFGESRNGPVTDNVYYIPGSRTFIAKFNPDLTELLFATVIGSGTTSSMSAGGPPPNPPSTDPHDGYVIPRSTIVPTAFRVDACKRIYFAGYGANQYWPMTDDSLHSFNSDYQFYSGVMEENATDFITATMYAGWHVDGGMSKFDENGVLYQAACISDTYFPVTSNAFSDGSAATGWDVCVFKIDMKNYPAEFVLPNIFTPNADGINDVYDPGVKKMRQFEIKIYDRWGSEVFSSNDIANKWDGTRNGSPCEEGVYYVTLRYGICETSSKTGFVHLQR